MKINPLQTSSHCFIPSTVSYYYNDVTWKLWQWKFPRPRLLNCSTGWSNNQETNFSEILIEILAFSFRKMRLKVSSAKRRPFCLGLNVLRPWWPCVIYNHSLTQSIYIVSTTPQVTALLLQSYYLILPGVYTNICIDISSYVILRAAMGHKKL